MGKGRVPREFLGAFKRGHRKGSQDFIDEEFSFALLKRVAQGCLEARAALEWLTRFNNEFHGGRWIKKDDPATMHRDQIIDGEFDRHGNPLTFRGDCYAREYASRNDVYTHPKVELLRTTAENFDPVTFLKPKKLANY